MSRAERLILAGFVTAGVVFRLWHWAFGRSLWIDEARLALNILGRPFAAMAEPLWFDQTAPLFFLVLTKAVANIWAPTEAALRFLPMIGGLISLPLAFQISKSALSTRAAWLCMAMLAASPIAIYYGNELKPYSTDVAVTLGIIALVLKSMRTRSRRLQYAAGVVGGAAVWLSNAALFVLPACVGALLLGRGWPRRRVATVAVAWGSMFALVWMTTYRAASSNDYLSRFWANRFWDPGPRWSGRVWDSIQEVVGGNATGLVLAPGESSWWVTATTLVVALMACLGFRALWHHDRPIAILVGAPIALLGGAACLGVFPITLRVTLFAAPLGIFLFTAGFDHLTARLSPRSQVTASIGLSLAVIGPLMLRSVGDAARPERWAPVRDVVQAIEADRGEQIPRYVAAGMLPTWLFYTTDWKQPDVARLQAGAFAGSWGGYAFENAGLEAQENALEPAGIGVDGSTELWGRSPGMEWIWGVGFSRLEPFEGWASSEASRIAGATRSGIWVLSAHSFGTEARLLKQLELAGFCIDERIGDGRAIGIHLERGDTCSNASRR